MSQWDEGQSLRDFVDSLNDTAVDLEPVTYRPPEAQPQAEQFQEDAEEAAKAKKKRLIIIITVAALVLAAVLGGFFFIKKSSALSSEYKNAYAEYVQVREEALTTLTATELLAQECRSAIEVSDCDALDAAIHDVEAKSPEIKETTPSTEEIEKLKKATEDLRQSLIGLETIRADVEEKMKDSIGKILQKQINEAKQSSASAKTLLRECQGGLENETDADALKQWIDDLDQAIEDARALLTDSTSGTLTPETTPATALSKAQDLRRLMDNIEDESAFVQQSHQNYLKAKEDESQTDNDESPAPSPSPSSSASTEPTPSGGGDEVAPENTPTTNSGNNN